MDLTLRYFDGCPNWITADERLKDALRVTGVTATVNYETVETPGDAERTGFRGSPTILIDGEDPFADQAGRVGLTCRMYRTEQGPEGAPSLEQLVVAIRR